MSTGSRFAGLGAAVACIALLCGCAGSSSADPYAGKSLKLVWSDNFSGKAGVLPSSDTWNFVTTGDGSGNNELECYTDAPGNISQNGKGDLVITAIKQPGHICADGSKNDYTSARINTQDKFVAKYGRIEVRAKVPTTSGTWPAFWALGADKPQVGWPKAGEIDVMEVVGNQPTVVHGTLHGPNSDGTAYSLEHHVDTGSNLAGKFHVFAADWSPDQVTFLLDGKPYGTETRAAVEKAGGQWVFTHSFYLLLNLAVGGNYPGNPTADAPWPQSYTIDYVRVYS